MSEEGRDRSTDAAQGGAAHHLVTRRALLGTSGVVALGIAASAGATPAMAAVSEPRVTTIPGGPYRSVPTLHPPKITVTGPGAPANEGYFIFTPSLIPIVQSVSDAQLIAMGKGQKGLMITDHHGQLVFFQPTERFSTNLQVQQYQGQPVLTYWTGNIDLGVGSGQARIMDSSYRIIAQPTMANGLKIDLHDFVLTPRGTALLVGYRLVNTNLTSVGGPASAPVWDCVIQEVDVATNAMVYQWSSLNHVPVSETKVPFTAGATMDCFHLNSLSEWDANNFLISSRNNWTLYKINKQTGKIVWRMGGDHSDFAMGPGTNFEWQHHARRQPNGDVTVFDNGAAPAIEAATRGLTLNVDEVNMTVTLKSAVSHVGPTPFLAPFEGSFQRLSSGNVVMGFGPIPVMSEMDSNGNALVDLHFPSQVQTYRVFRQKWVGRPKTTPAISIVRNPSGSITYRLSWNGATEVASWRLMAGSTASTLKPVKTVPRSGFETAATVSAPGTHFAADALDSSGRRLARSWVMTA